MENISLEINKRILDSDLYKKYIFLKKIIEEDDYLKDIKERMDILKKGICASKDDIKTDQYYELEKEYKNSVVVKEYLRIKEELNILFKDIVDILSLN